VPQALNYLEQKKILKDWGLGILLHVSIFIHSSLNKAGRDKTLNMDPTPMTQLAYPIPHFDGDGSLHVFGNQNASHLVIMCAGFPDDQRAASLSSLGQAFGHNGRVAGWSGLFALKRR
jgi:hypothetical protein